jgi:hypothetical protein
MRITAATASGLMFALLALSGCGGGVEGITPVHGTVTYKGQPLTEGEVNFVPDGGGPARGARGLLDSSGYYTLGTFDAADGAYAGKYKVTVIARGPDLPVPARKKGKMMEEDMQGSGKPLIPRRYFNPTTSQLSAEVVDGKTNEINFELKD